MTIEQKLQIEAIKGIRLYYAEYRKLVFISDGKIGVYLNESELKIDKTKMNKIPNPDIFDPKVLVKEKVRAKETDIARKGVRSFYIKLKAINTPNFCYVDEAFLKMFPGYGALYIKGEKELVYIEKYGQPYGIIMPVYVSKEEE